MYPSSALIKTHSSFKETHVLYYIKDSMTSRTEFGVVQLAYTPFIDSETSLEEFPLIRTCSLKQKRRVSRRIYLPVIAAFSFCWRKFIYFAIRSPYPSPRCLSATFIIPSLLRGPSSDTSRKIGWVMTWWKTGCNGLVIFLWSLRAAR